MVTVNTILLFNLMLREITGVLNGSFCKETLRFKFSEAIWRLPSVSSYR
jgi:hypothetical protein